MANDFHIHRYKDEGRGFTCYYFMTIFGSAYGRGYYFESDRKTWYISDLSVEPQHQGRGIGRKTIETIEDFGLVNECETAKLWVFNETWQKEWYKRRGYVEAGEYEGEENAVWMVKSLFHHKWKNA